MAKKPSAFCSEGVGMATGYGWTVAAPSPFSREPWRKLTAPSHGSAQYVSINSERATSPTIWRLRCEMRSMVSLIVW